MPLKHNSPSAWVSCMLASDSPGEHSTADCLQRACSILEETEQTHRNQKTRENCLGPGFPAWSSNVTTLSLVDTKPSLLDSHFDQTSIRGHRPTKRQTPMWGLGTIWTILHQILQLRLEPSADGLSGWQVLAMSLSLGHTQTSLEYLRYCLPFIYT